MPNSRVVVVAGEGQTPAASRANVEIDRPGDGVEYSAYLSASVHAFHTSSTLRGKFSRDSITGPRCVVEEEVLGYGNIRALGLDDRRVSTDPPEILVPLTVKVADGELSLFTTLTTFGTPQDITLDELVIELFYPADEASQQLLRAAR